MSTPAYRAEYQRELRRWSFRIINYPLLFGKVPYRQLDHVRLVHSQ